MPIDISLIYIYHTSMATKHTKEHISAFEETLDEYFGKKAPQLPLGFKEGIVKFSPWIIFIFLILSLPAVLTLLGIGAYMSPYMYMGPGAHLGFLFELSLIILVVTIILEAMAIPKLMRRSKKGWDLIFYSVLLGLISSLISFNFFNFIIGAIISFYFLFQVRSFYK